MGENDKAAQGAFLGGAYVILRIHGVVHNLYKRRNAIIHHSN